MIVKKLLESTMNILLMHDSEEVAQKYSEYIYKTKECLSFSDHCI